MTTLDMRGKQCPIPVVETKKKLAEMKKGEVIETWVDNEIAVQNLQKMASQKGLAAEAETAEKNFYKVRITAGEDGQAQTAQQTCEVCQPTTSGIVVVFSADHMGEGDDALGQPLMKGFIYALTSQEVLPDTLLFYNGGAKLTTEGSAALEDLKLLESQGVEILTCGTCLNHYGLSEKLAVGSVTNMYVICEKQLKAAKVIKP